MSGLVRADTELMLVAANEMKRVSGVLQEQLQLSAAAMEQLQATWWNGQHRAVVEDAWSRIAEQFWPAADTLLSLALRLRHTAAALDAAALLFDEPGANADTGSWPGYLAWLEQLVANHDPLAAGLGIGNPLAMLATFLRTPLGQALRESTARATMPAAPPLVAGLPADGPAPRIFVINGINSRALPGTPDPSALGYERRLEELGYDPAEVTATPAVYNTAFGNPVLNPLVGVLQVVGEYVLGENGYYTSQTLSAIQGELRAHPLAPGQQVMLVAHSGGGAIAPTVARALHEQGLAETMGVVTIGSPVANHDDASGYAQRVVAIRDAHDLIGLPALRSHEARSATAVGAAAQGALLPVIVADIWRRERKPNVTNATTHSGEQAPIGAHLSYWSSEETLDLIEAAFPAIDRELRRRGEPDAATPDTTPAHQ